jgi:hypothetical protein
MGAEATGEDIPHEEVLRRVHVTGNNIEVTPAMNEYVFKKLGKVLTKGILEDSIMRVDVHLSVVLNPKVCVCPAPAEAVLGVKLAYAVQCPGGRWGGNTRTPVKRQSSSRAARSSELPRRRITCTQAST